jgi:hypothetical protein
MAIFSHKQQQNTNFIKKVQNHPIFDKFSCP